MGNEQLTDDDNDNEEDLKYSDSEDETEKQERLAREALKSYAGAYKKDEAPEDYQLVMRKDVVEKELADTEDTNYETAEDIEFREKRETVEYEVNITTEVKPIEENPFYSSYEALETKDDLEDPLKEERERIRVQQEEDEKELKKLQEKSTPVFEEPEEAPPPKKKTKIEI